MPRVRVSTCQITTNLEPALPSVVLTAQQLCDLELLLTGAYSPLEGYMDEAAYDSVAANQRLPSGLPWPLPVALDVDAGTAAACCASPGQQVALRDAEHNLIAVLTVQSTFTPDHDRVAQLVFGADAVDSGHPGALQLMRGQGRVMLAGSVEGVSLPRYYDFDHRRVTATQAREQLVDAGWGRFMTVFTRSPMHAPDVQAAREAARSVQARMLLVAAVGPAPDGAGEVPYATRVWCYEAIMAKADQLFGKVSCRGTNPQRV